MKEIKLLSLFYNTINLATVRRLPFVNSTGCFHPTPASSFAPSQISVTLTNPQPPPPPPQPPELLLTFDSSKIEFAVRKVIGNRKFQIFLVYYKASFKNALKRSKRFSRLLFEMEQLFLIRYLWEPPYLHFKSVVVKMPVHDDREDVSHRLSAERVDGDDVKVPQESRRDLVPPAPRRPHGRHQQLINKLQDWRVFPDNKLQRPTQFHYYIRTTSNWWPDVKIFLSYIVQNLKGQFFFNEQWNYYVKYRTCASHLLKQMKKVKVLKKISALYISNK